MDNITEGGRINESNLLGVLLEVLSNNLFFKRLLCLQDGQLSDDIFARQAGQAKCNTICL